MRTTSHNKKITTEEMLYIMQEKWTLDVRIECIANVTEWDTHNYRWVVYAKDLFEGWLENNDLNPRQAKDKAEYEADGVVAALGCPYVFDSLELGVAINSLFWFLEDHCDDEFAMKARPLE